MFINKKKIIFIVAITLVIGYLSVTNAFTDFTTGFKDGWNSVSQEGGTPTYVRRTVHYGNICEIKLKIVKSELFQMV